MSRQGCFVTLPRRRAVPPGSPAAEQAYGGPVPLQRFTATLAERGLVVPVDAKAIWGEARPPVSCTINGHPYSSRLMVYGGETWLGLTNAFRKENGLAEGDTVEVEIDRDDTPREV